MYNEEWLSVHLHVRKSDRLAPVGNGPVFTLTETVDSQPCVHELNYVVPIAPDNKTYVASVIAKSDKRSLFFDICLNQSSGGVRSVFDLTQGQYIGGVVSYGNSGWRVQERSCDDLGDGWYRIRVVLAMTAEQRHSELRLRIGPHARMRMGLDYAGTGEHILLGGLDFTEGTEPAAEPRLFPQPARIRDCTPGTSATDPDSAAADGFPPAAPAQVHVSVGGKTADWIEGDGWYRGEVVNFFPDKASLYARDGLDEFILKGWLPSKPFITRDHAITAFGSCFATHVERYLASQGYRVSTNLYRNVTHKVTETHINYWSKSLLVKCSEGFVNTFSIRYQFEWIWEDRIPELRLWHRSENQIREYVENNKEAAAALMEETDIFIITLGLSEVWYNKQTGDVLWTSVPRRHFDPDIFGFRVTTVEENRDNLEAIYRLIRKNKGDVPIIFTLSPVPLNATFRPISCISANSVSKATLRVAVDEFIRKHEDDGNLFYFPSYEIVKEYWHDPFIEDNRHVNNGIVDGIMRKFEEKYCVTDEAAPSP